MSKTRSGLTPPETRGTNARGTRGNPCRAGARAGTPVARERHAGHARERCAGHARERCAGRAGTARDQTRAGTNPTLVRGNLPPPLPDTVRREVSSLIPECHRQEIPSVPHQGVLVYHPSLTLLPGQKAEVSRAVPSAVHDSCSIGQTQRIEDYLAEAGRTGGSVSCSPAGEPRRRSPSPAGNGSVVASNRAVMAMRGRAPFQTGLCLPAMTTRDPHNMTVSPLVPLTHIHLRSATFTQPPAPQSSPPLQSQAPRLARGPPIVPHSMTHTASRSDRRESCSSHTTKL
jgi:hypothetical protein